MTNYPTLPDAIRIGVKIRPQTTGSCFKNDCSCALGAAMEGSGILSNQDYQDSGPIYREKIKLFYSTYHSLQDGIRRDRNPLWAKIADMQDEDGKTREEIADILETEGVTY